ncbi:MAG: DUF7507 domain-containing protein [Limisphaerales bacterium]
MATTLLLAFLASGCVSRWESRTYSFDASDHRGPQPVQTTTVTQTTVAPAPAPTVHSTSGSNFDFRSSLVEVTKHSPPTAAVGQTFENTIMVNPRAHVGDVELVHYIPANAQYVRSEPPATVSGQKLTWTWKELKEGDRRDVKVWITPTAEGALRSCSTIHALPFGCIVTQVGKPSLSIEKTGPAMAQIGERFTYNIIVRNTGTSPAKNVEVTDDIPPGLSHDTGKQQLVFDAGDLQPGDAKQATVTVTANQRGTFTNRATAKSDNAGTVSDTAVTKVVQPGLKVVKTGPAEQFLGKIARYNITVSNIGDTTLENVTVTDLPPSNAVVTDVGGAQQNGQQASWSVGTLAAGQSRSMTLDLTARQAGVTVNRVTATANGGLSDSAEAQTLWKGYPAVLIEMVDNPDPLLAAKGEATTYTIRVTNQGTAPDSNVRLVVEFPGQVTPTAAGGATSGQIQGNVVTFATLPSIAAKQVATWTINAKATSVGDARIAAKLTTSLLKTPVIEVEATQVY